MKKVLITGVDGFIGKNLRVMLDRDKDIEILRFVEGDSSKDLAKKVSSADFIFHLAGLDWAKDDKALDISNYQLTQSLVDLLKKRSKQIPVVFASTVEADNDTPYGRSKKAAEGLLLEWAKTSKNDLYIYRLPEVFGKWSTPNHNSIVATLCNDVAHDRKTSLKNASKSITLVYIDDIVREFLRTLAGETKKLSDNFYRILTEFHVTPKVIAGKLTKIKDGRQKLFVPNLQETFDQNLYATFTSYFTKDQVSYVLDKKSDDRGWLAEVVKSDQFGQIFVSRTNPGFTRAIHWHNTKVEKFLVIEGDAEISLRQIDSDKIETFKVNSKELRVIEAPTGYVHTVKNVGKTDVFLMIWAHKVFDPEDPDTLFQEI